MFGGLDVWLLGGSRVSSLRSTIDGSADHNKNNHQKANSNYVNGSGSRKGDGYKNIRSKILVLLLM